MAYKPTADPDASTIDQLKGALYGALVGDALGVPVEFMTRAELAASPVTKMEGYGAWMQPRGTWSDDGALTLASAETLVNYGLKYDRMADAFCAWWRLGDYCAGNKMFDIGGVTRTALTAWEVNAERHNGTPAYLMGGDREMDNGNGSLMRIMPVALFTAYDEDFPQGVENASSITHRHMQSRLACAFYAMLAQAIVKNPTMSRIDLFHITRNAFLLEYGVSGKPQKYEPFWRITNPLFAQIPEDMIRSSGYVIDSMEASVWCWLNTDSFEAATLRAVNLGGDTDTTGCITGALAGLYYGFDAIPTKFTRYLRKPKFVAHIADNFANAVVNHWWIVRK